MAVALGAAPLLVPARSTLSAAPRCEVTGASRVVAIGDVHGAADRFVEILKATNLVDDKAHWSGGTAHLVQLGDVVDRGPESRAALDLLRRLEGEAEKAGGAVHALLGNHEVARILGDMRYATAGEYQAFASADSDMLRDRYLTTVKSDERDQIRKDTPLGMLELRSAFGRQGSYGEWLRKHDGVVKINGVVFVHGGISPAVAAMPCDQINDTVRRELTNDIEKTRSAPLASLAAREDGPFWYRGLSKLAPTDAAAFESVLTLQHARAIVVAHTVTTDGRIRMGFDGRLFQIDTGMQPAYVQGGRASALEFAGAKVSAVYVDRRDPLVDSF
jgi:hypothetical protein